MEEIDLKKLFQLFWNRKVQILLIIAIFIVIGIIYTIGFVTPKYTSSTTLVLATATNDTNASNSITTSDVTLNSKLVSTYSELVKSKKVLREVISNLGINISEEKIRSGITVSSVKDTELIEIAVTNEDPNLAAQVANETAKVFTKNVSEIYNINNVHVVDEAEESTVPSNVNHTKDVIIFAFIGIVVAVIYVLILNMLDTTIESAQDVEELLQLPVLASIPLNDFEIKKTKGGRR